MEQQMIFHNGEHYMISQEAYDALCEAGPMDEDERDDATHTILRAEGFPI